jgi:hypothetical protein
MAKKDNKNKGGAGGGVTVVPVNPVVAHQLLAQHHTPPPVDGYSDELLVLQQSANVRNVNLARSLMAMIDSVCGGGYARYAPIVPGKEVEWVYAKLNMYLPMLVKMLLDKYKAAVLKESGDTLKMVRALVREDAQLEAQLTILPALLLGSIYGQLGLALPNALTRLARLFAGYDIIESTGEVKLPYMPQAQPTEEEQQQQAQEQQQAAP